jgi:hypothetical protein
MLNKILCIIIYIIMNFYSMLKLLENESKHLNLLNNRADVLAAFELMEGKHTLESKGRNSMKAAIEWLENPDEGSYTVYGDGGLHRYFVRNNGDIEFSALHVGWQNTVKKAIDLGFKIHPYNWKSLPRFN